MTNNKANINLLSPSLDSDVLTAYNTFLESLTVRNPRQLVLVQPHIVPEDLFDLGTARRQGYYAYPPVGLLYIAAVAKKVNPNIDVRVVDLNCEHLRHSQSDEFSYEIWKELLFDAIKACDAPHVGVTYMFGTTKHAFVEVTKFIRENFPDVPLLSGGVQASYDFKELLETGLCDMVVRNEGELQIEAFLERCVDQTSKAVPWGSAFRLNGQVYQLDDPHRDVPMDSDIRPFYSSLDIQNYHQYGSLGAFSRLVGEDMAFATVLSNRGCRARCTFCTVRDFNGFGIRQRSVDNVIDEIKFLVEEKGVQQIDWLDDDLLWNPTRAVELFQRMAEEFPELQWTSSNGLIAAAISDEIMYWMAKSGIQAFKIGIESGNDKMLHTIKKPTTKPKLREKRELFKQYPDVFVCANFMIGFPNETFGEMMDSFDFANELDWDWCQYNICQPLKGTEIFSAFQELGDDRCDEETYEKTINPARSSMHGEIPGQYGDGPSRVRTGMDIFNIPYDSIPDSEQLREIWFSFNLVTNFFKNLNFKPEGNPRKIIKWFEAIFSGYPYDASMCAALAKGYQLMGNNEKSSFYQETFESIVSESAYWQRRVEEFPEMGELAGLSSLSADPQRPAVADGPAESTKGSFSGGAI